MFAALMSGVLAACGSVVAVGTDAHGDRENVLSNDWSLEGATPDGKTLLISTSFGGVASNCTRFEGFEVDASADAVTVLANLWVNPDAQSCTDDGAGETLMLTLANPLGERELLGCGVDDCLQATSGFSGSQRTAYKVAEHVAIASYEEVIHLDDASGEVLGGTTIFGQTSAIGDVLIVGTDGGMAGLNGSPDDTRAWDREGLYGPVGSAADLVFGCGQDSMGLVAIDAETGADRWSAPKAPCEFIGGIGDLVFVVGRDPDVDGGTRLFVLNSDSGDVTEQRSLDDGIDDQVAGFAGMVATPDGVLLAGYQSDTLLLGPTGEEIARWTARLGRPLAMIGETIVVEGVDQVGAYTIAVDEWLWKLDGANVSELSIDGAHIAAGRMDGVDLLDTSTGDAIWSTDIGRASSFRTTITESSVYATSELVVAKLDRETGELLWWTELPAAAGSTIELEADATVPAESLDDVELGVQEIVPIPFTLLAEGGSVGEPYTVQVAKTDVEFEELGLQGDVDLETQVVFAFTLAESGSPNCALQPMTGLSFDNPHSRLYPEVALLGDTGSGETSCTADANPHQIVVAVNRTDLPKTSFSAGISPGDAPGCCESDVLFFAEGELTAIDAEFPPLGSDGALDVGETRIMYGLTSHCGVGVIFRPIDGSQWKAVNVSEMTGIDPMPEGWSKINAEGSESINLVIERTGPDTLTATAVGTDVSVDYQRLSERTFCQ